MLEAFSATSRGQTLFGRNGTGEKAGGSGCATFCTSPAAPASGGTFLAMRCVRRALDAGVWPAPRNLVDATPACHDESGNCRSGCAKWRGL